jgi:peptide/nickel transport system substrate-binding protein
MPPLTRRAFLAAAATGIAALSFVRAARALGRTPIGGRVVMHLPWPTTSIDPHDLRDGTAALLAHAIADPIYALDAAGNPYPALATALPAREGDVTAVRLREGMRTARGVNLDARDVVFSIERAKARGGAALLADVPVPRTRKGEPYTADFPGPIDPARLSRALASPLCALLPRRFTAATPDGTGAFKAEPSTNGLALTRNSNAARGASFLDAIDIARAEDLKASLRSFEAERDDVGWLGTGLFDSRKGAVKFDLGVAAWVVLTTGPDAGSFGMPGVAQRLVDAVPPDRLAHLGLGVLPKGGGDPGWGGPTAELLVDEEAAHLVEIARALAPILSRSGHEVTATPIARAELAKRRAKGKATLALDVVRPLGPGPLLTLVSLAAADDVARAKDLVRHPPKIAPGASARSLTSSLRLAVVGEVRVAGGTAPDLVLARSGFGDGWDLGGSFRRVKR